MAPQNTNTGAKTANAFFLGLILVIGIGAVWLFTTEPDLPSPADEPEIAVADMSLGAFSFDVARLEREWSEARSAAELAIQSDLSEADQRLVDEYLALNRQLAVGDLTESQLAAAEEHFVVSVSRYLAAHGPRQYGSLGWRMAVLFEAAFDEACEQAAGRSLQELLRDPDPSRDRLRAQLGHFPTQAPGLGLIDDDGSLLVEPALLTTMFRMRWARFARDYPATAWLSRYEHHLYWRYHVEHNGSASANQRLAILRAMPGIYDEAELDIDAVRGIISYQAGDHPSAVAFLRRAIASDPDNSQYQTWLSVAERRVGGE